MNLNFGHSPLTAGARAAGEAGTSFLPEDYLLRKKERRSNFISLSLFCVVMFGVIAAFFVTSRQWNDVKAHQAAINAEYTAEGKKIDQLNVLEAQKQEMMEKAEITAALIERVPRSILLAELINRMPEQLTLTDLKLSGKRIKDAPPPEPKDKAKPKARSLVASSSSGGKDDAPPPPKPLPPKFDFTLELIGLAAADEKVADYQASLKDCPLLENVDLVYTGVLKVDEVERRKFRIEAKIRPAADARNIQPLHIERKAMAGRIMIGEDGKPVLRSDPWMSKFGIFPGKEKGADAGKPEPQQPNQTTQAPDASQGGADPSKESAAAPTAAPGQEVHP